MHERDTITRRPNDHERTALFAELHRWRRRYEVSLEEAAAMAGLHRETLRRYEAGIVIRPYAAALARVRALIANPAPERWPSAAQLRAWREAHGITQAELAAMLGISRRTLSRLTTDKPIARTRARLQAFWRAQERAA